MAAKPSGPSATAVSASSSGSEVTTTSQAARSASCAAARAPVKRRCPLRVSVIDEHLMTVFNEINGKGVSHLVETDHTDASDSETSEHLARQLIVHVTFPSCFSGWD